MGSKTARNKQIRWKIFTNPSTLSTLLYAGCATEHCLAYLWWYVGKRYGRYLFVLHSDSSKHETTFETPSQDLLRTFGNGEAVEVPLLCREVV